MTKDRLGGPRSLLVPASCVLRSLPINLNKFQELENILQYMHCS
jgi:hypothetical protein